MWLSFWVTMSFGVLFVVVETVFERPLPLAVGVVPATVVSIATNGWEGFLHWQFHNQDKLCVQVPDTGRLRCWDATSMQLPDAARPPDPPGWVEVVMPWWGYSSTYDWLLTDVPLDLAASGLAAGVVWLALRPFGRHRRVDVTPFD